MLMWRSDDRTYPRGEKRKADCKGEQTQDQKAPSHLRRVHSFLEARGQKNVRVLRAAHLLPQRLGKILRQDLHLVSQENEKHKLCAHTQYCISCLGLEKL